MTHEPIRIATVTRLFSPEEVGLMVEALEAGASCLEVLAAGSTVPSSAAKDTAKAEKQRAVAAKLKSTQLGGKFVPIDFSQP